MTIVTKYTTPAAAGAEVDRRAEAYMSEHQGVSYKEALHAVLRSDKQLAEAYAQPAARTMATKPVVHVPAPVPLALGQAPSEEVHRRTVALREMDTGLTYQRAVRLVLGADPALKAAYAGVQS